MFNHASFMREQLRLTSKTRRTSLTLLILVLLTWFLAACRSANPELSLPHVSFNSVDISSDGRYLVIGGMLTDKATRAPSDTQPYSQNPGRLWIYDPSSGDLQMLRFPLDVSKGQLSASGYLAFYGTDQPYQFILDEIWFTTDPQTVPPVELKQVPAGVVYWAWYPNQNIMLLGVEKPDDEFSIGLYDPVQDRMVQSEWFGGHGQLGEFDLSWDERYLALTIDKDICILERETDLLNCQNTPSYEAYPRWSPDMGKLAYQRCSGSRCVLVISKADRQCEYEIARFGGRIAWESETVFWATGWGVYRVELGEVLGDKLQVNGDLICSQ